MDLSQMPIWQQVLLALLLFFVALPLAASALLSFMLELNKELQGFAGGVKAFVTQALFPMVAMAALLLATIVAFNVSAKAAAFLTFQVSKSFSISPVALDSMYALLASAIVSVILLLAISVAAWQSPHVRNLVSNAFQRITEMIGQHWRVKVGGIIYLLLASGYFLAAEK